jgi:hypothetical protein
VALRGVVAKPEHKAKRKHDNAVPNVQGTPYTTTVPNDDPRDQQHASYTLVVNLTGVIDTSGVYDPTSLLIADSPDTRLSAAVCAAALQMAFAPAEDHGQKVRTEYKERFTFYYSHREHDLVPNSTRTPATRSY